MSELADSPGGQPDPGCDACGCATIDAVASAGDDERYSAIERWGSHGSMRVAMASDGEVAGYCVSERAFLGHAFAVHAHGGGTCPWPGVGAGLLLDAQQHRASGKLFTSTNLSNQPMQRLMARLGWRSVGIVYGLDEGGPELFLPAPTGGEPD